MQHWLLKSEPGTWSWQQQCDAPGGTTHWNGVHNNLALKHMRSMKKGDLGFFYHSNDGKCIVGVVEIAGEFEPEPGSKSGWVHVKAVHPVEPPVTLAQIRANPALKDMVLVNNSRLSVQPVTAGEWKLVEKMAKQAR